MAEIQLDLVFDYQSNVAAYPQWQAYLRDSRPPTLVIWGKNDPLFTKRDKKESSRRVLISP